MPTRTELVRVLLVEDSPDHQMLASRALRKAGYEVEVAGSGEEAVERLGVGPAVHLVLIDQGLPRMSGTEVLEHVVAMPDGPGAIMVTASAARDLVVAAMRAGAVDFVSKEAGYLDMLPAVVERSYRQWDLRQRTSELQRLSLLVHDASGLEETVSEVVDGICRLLRAPTAVLLLRDEEAGVWRTAARVGEVGSLSSHVASDLAESIGTADAPIGVLAVALPSEPNEQRGALLVARDPARPFVGEEEQLAKTFAAFASSALRQSRRAELEGGLIEELQQTIRARRDFVASVSHELRTPLTSIGGYAETILEHHERIDPSMLLDLVGRVRRHAGDLEALIDQLLDVAKLERGTRFTPAPVDLPLSVAMAHAIDGLAHVLEGRDVDVDVEDVLVHADPDFISRIMANLLTNAVKYSLPGTRIWVTARRNGANVEVIVRDQGVGIDPEDTVLAFQPFWRAGHAVAQAVRGTGIGLSLVSEYVHSMGGTVGCRPGPGDVGSDFWFTMPVIVDVTI